MQATWQGWQPRHHSCHMFCATCCELGCASLGSFALPAVGWHTCVLLGKQQQALACTLRRLLCADIQTAAAGGALLLHPPAQRPCSPADTRFFACKGAVSVHPPITAVHAAASWRAELPCWLCLPPVAHASCSVLAVARALAVATAAGTNPCVMRGLACERASVQFWPRFLADVCVCVNVRAGSQALLCCEIGCTSWHAHMPGLPLKGGVARWGGWHGVRTRPWWVTGCEQHGPGWGQWSDPW